MKQGIVIKNINILSMISDEIDYNKSIRIVHDTIENIDNEIVPQENDTVIDCQGKYIIPGLINMHTHIGDQEQDLLLYLANGVTTIRNMWGYGFFHLGQWMMGTRVFRHLKLKNEIEEGRKLGPRIITAGPLLDGKNSFFPKFMQLHALDSRSEIQSVIERQSKAGYDFIKIYSRLSLENFRDIMEISKQYGKYVVGHVPDVVTVEEAINEGMHSIEHLTGYINFYEPYKNIKKDEIDRLAGLTAEKQVWNCPTLIAHQRLANINNKDRYEKEEQMKFISKRQLKGMRFLQKESSKMIIKLGVKPNHEYMEDLYILVSALKKAGAGILLGTDKATPYVVAGFSEHKEMQLLHEAGLSNYEVLQASTVEGAKCLSLDKKLGTIQVGYLADMIITDENPLENLKTISNPNRIIKSGKVYKPGELLSSIRV